MKEILIITSRRPRRDDALSMLRELCIDAISRAEEKANVTNVVDVRAASASIQDRISEADIVLADVSGSRQDVMYELGFAHASGKPTILVSDESGKPTLYDLAGLYVHLYPKSGHNPAFRERIVSELTNVMEDPDRFVYRNRTNGDPTPARPMVFISYSHSDGGFLNRLRVHLRPLERMQAIEYWDDGVIVAGERWRDEIEGALKQAKMAVLLISADFLASDFVIESELPALLSAAEKQGTIILPVVLKPSRFLRDKKLSVFQCVNDPHSPLIGLSEAEQERVYARIAERIENELHSLE